MSRQASGRRSQSGGHGELGVGDARIGFNPKVHRKVVGRESEMEWVGGWVYNWNGAYRNRFLGLLVEVVGVKGRWMGRIDGSRKPSRRWPFGTCCRFSALQVV
jgi:hypothetical protein